MIVAPAGTLIIVWLYGYSGVGNESICQSCNHKGQTVTSGLGSPLHMIEVPLPVVRYIGIKRMGSLTCNIHNRPVVCRVPYSIKYTLGSAIHPQISENGVPKSRCDSSEQLEKGPHR